MLNVNILRKTEDKKIIIAKLQKKMLRKAFSGKFGLNNQKYNKKT